MRNVYIIWCLLATLLAGCGDNSDGDNPTGGDETKTPQLYFSPTSATISVGQETDIQLLFANLSPSIFAVSLQLAHNDAVAEFPDSLGFAAGTFFGANAISFAQPDDSLIHLSLSRIQGQSAVGGSGPVGTLTFTGLAVGIDTIRVLSEELHFYDSTGSEITLSTMETKTAIIKYQ